MIAVLEGPFLRWHAAMERLGAAGLFQRLHALAEQLPLTADAGRRSLRRTQILALNEKGEATCVCAPSIAAESRLSA